MAPRWRRNRSKQADVTPNDDQADGYRLSAVSGADSEELKHGVAIFGPDLSAPLLAEPGVARCLVPSELRAAVAELCRAERAGVPAKPEAVGPTLDWLLANPSAGDVNAFAMLTEICVRAGRLAGAADKRVRAIRNAHARGITNGSCELQLKIELAKALSDTGDCASAVTEYDYVVKWFRANGFAAGLRDVLPQFAWVLAQTGDVPRAQDALDEWAPLAQTANEASLLWHYRASILRFVYTREERIDMYHRSLSLLDESRSGASEGAIRVDLATALMEERTPSDAAAAAEELQRAISLFDSVGDLLHGTRARAALVVARVDAGELSDPSVIDEAFAAVRGLRAASGDQQGDLADRWNRIRALEEAGAISDGHAALRELESISADARAARNLSLWAVAVERRVRLELRGAAPGRTVADPADPYHGLIAELYELSRLLRDVRAGYANPLERSRATRHYVDSQWWLVILLLKSDQAQLALLAADELRSATAEVEARNQMLRSSAPADQRARETILMQQLETTHDAAEAEQIRHELRSVQRSYRKAMPSEPAAERPDGGWGEVLEARHEALIAFTCHEMGIVMFIVVGSEIHQRWILADPGEEFSEPADQLYQRAREFIWSIEQAAGGGGDPEQPIRHGHWLWRVLIAPYMEAIGDRNLVIIPDGALHGVPWAAVLTAPSMNDGELEDAFLERWEARPWKNRATTAGVEATLTREGAAFTMWLDEWGSLSYLGGERQVRVSMSLAALGRAPGRSWRQPRCVVGVADPSAGPTGEVSDLVERLRAGKLAALPDARVELTNLMSELSQRSPAAEAHALVGPTATRQALAELIERHAPDWLHVAAHGQVDVDEPLRSRIFLAPDESGSRADLTIEWLYANPVRVSLVVLSCCETALGLRASQEAVVGLPRAFLAGGARTVVATLWRVPDDPRLMHDFYRHLLSGLEPDAALMEAQRSLMQASAHPVVWAGHQCYS